MKNNILLHFGQILKVFCTKCTPLWLIRGALTGGNRTKSYQNLTLAGYNYYA